MKRHLTSILNIIVVLLSIICLALFSYYIYKLDIIPDRHLVKFYLIYGVVVLFMILLVINLFETKKLLYRVLSSILLVIISGCLLYFSNYLRNTYRFLNNTQVEYDYLKYSVVVLNDSSYNNLKDLKDKTIGYIDDDYKNLVKTELKDKIKYSEYLFENTSRYFDSLKHNEVDAIVLEEGYYTLAMEEISDFKDKIKVIDTFTIKVDAYKEESNVDVTQEPFIIYISGIDQYGSVNSVRGRSDVNQLMIINPKTHHILMVNTPRDYYVHLAGTTGLRDKLTHAGIYGINKSIDTIESIYDIDINNYIRINFDSLIKVVDLIGGIDIYSDKSFRCWTSSSVYVNQGWNHFNGRQALAYSRERKTYVDGDFHRGRNQQQVIETIIEKLTTSNTVIKKYNSILNSLDGSFQTDIPTTTITSFIKYQLDKMPNWNIETMQANGYSSWGYTYSMGYNYYLWVMEPDWNSINQIKARIKEVLNEEVSYE